MWSLTSSDFVNSMPCTSASLRIRRGCVKSALSFKASYERFALLGIAVHYPPFVLQWRNRSLLSLKDLLKVPESGLYLTIYILTILQSPGYSVRCAILLFLFSEIWALISWGRSPCLLILTFVTFQVLCWIVILICLPCREYLTLFLLSPQSSVLGANFNSSWSDPHYSYGFVSFLVIFVFPPIIVHLKKYLTILHVPWRSLLVSDYPSLLQ